MDKNAIQTNVHYANPRRKIINLTRNASLKAVFTADTERYGGCLAGPQRNFPRLGHADQWMPAYPGVPFNFEGDSILPGGYIRGCLKDEGDRILPCRNRSSLRSNPAGKAHGPDLDRSLISQHPIGGYFNR